MGVDGVGQMGLVQMKDMRRYVIWGDAATSNSTQFDWVILMNRPIDLVLAGTVDHAMCLVPQGSVEDYAWFGLGDNRGPNGSPMQAILPDLALPTLSP
jgi:hypothetical protein